LPVLQESGEDKFETRPTYIVSSGNLLTYLVGC